jgi:hypothetical protein
MTAFPYPRSYWAVIYTDDDGTWEYPAPDEATARRWAARKENSRAELVTVHAG